MNIQLMKGDCLQLMDGIQTGSIDMILCDLPYGTTRNRWDSILPLDRLWSQYERIIKDNGAILLFSQTPFTQILGASNMKMLRYEWIWEKEMGSGFLNCNRMPLKKHENILVFYKRLPTYNPQMTEGKPYTTTNGPSTNYNVYESNFRTVNDGWRYPLDIIQCNKETGYHPTQKPVKLLEYLIKTYTNEGEIVLDNCMGSGSTGVAALNTGRRFIGIEKEDSYFAIAKERIKTAQLKCVN